MSVRLHICPHFVFLQKVCTHAYQCMLQESVCMCLYMYVSDIPVMIDPRLSLSTLTHQCCFKCLLPWKQAAGIQVWYTDNGLSLSLFLSLSPLSLSFPLNPCCSTRRLPNFLSHSPFALLPLSVSCLDFHSFMSVFPHQGFPLLAHSPSFHSV